MKCNFWEKKKTSTKKFPQEIKSDVLTWSAWSGKKRIEIKTKVNVMKSPCEHDVYIPRLLAINDDMLPLWERLECWLVVAISRAARVEMKAHDLAACSLETSRQQKEEQEKHFFYLSTFLSFCSFHLHNMLWMGENNYHGHRHNFVIGSYSVVWFSSPDSQFRENKI